MLFKKEKVNEEEKKNENIREIKAPNKIIQKINLEKNFDQPFIISKYIKLPNNRKANPNMINLKKFNNYDKLKYIQHISKSKNAPLKNNIDRISLYSSNKNITNNNINIYNKKRLSSDFTFSSIPSKKNSFISNLNLSTNNINNNEYIPYINYMDYQIKNRDNLKINNKEKRYSNILIKNIYGIDDYFDKNTKKGILDLKNIEILKTKKISIIDISNKEILKNKIKNFRNSLGNFITKSNEKMRKNHSNKEIKNLKNYKINKSYDCNNKRIRSFSNIFSSKELKERKLKQLPKEKRNTIYKRGNIFRLIYYFNKKTNSSDILITRAMRNEKGGVVDLATSSTKKNYKSNNYIKDKDFIKNSYKYSKWKIIASAKIIQKWWKSKLLIYNNYLKKIKMIQKVFRNYKAKKNKNKNRNRKINKNDEMKKNKKIDLNNQNNIRQNLELNNLENKLKNFSAIFLKKIIQIRINDYLNYFLLKMKNFLLKIQNKKLSYLKNIHFIITIKEHFNRMKNKNILFFLRKLQLEKYSKNKYYEEIKYKNIFSKGIKSLNINDSNKSNEYIILNDSKINKRSFGPNLDIYFEQNEKSEKDKNFKYEDNKNNSSNQSNKFSKNSSKINSNEKEIIIFSNIRNEPNDISKYILKKKFFKRWNSQIFNVKNLRGYSNNIRNKYQVKTNHLLLKRLMITIIEKIKKEANRRTLIKAFRNINKLKYPSLFYSFLKIKKYTKVKYNIMNAYAKIIQKNYRYFKDKKSKISFYSISDDI